MGTELLSPSALRFAKANSGMIQFDAPKQIRTKIELTKERTTRDRPPSKLMLAKTLCERYKTEPRKTIIQILMDELTIPIGTATVYACTCLKALNSK